AGDPGPETAPILADRPPLIPADGDDSEGDGLEGAVDDGVETSPRPLPLRPLVEGLSPAAPRPIDAAPHGLTVAPRAGQEPLATAVAAGGVALSPAGETPRTAPGPSRDVPTAPSRPTLQRDVQLEPSSG